MWSFGPIGGSIRSTRDVLLWMKLSARAPLQRERSMR